jgi:hypothetical protein
MKLKKKIPNHHYAITICQLVKFKKKTLFNLPLSFVYSMAAEYVPRQSP